MKTSTRRVLLVALIAIGLALAMLPLRRRADAPAAPAPVASFDLPTNGHGGRITDMHGQPLAGARIELVFVGENDAPRAIASAIANEAGVYSIATARPPGASGVLLLRASAVGYAMDGRVVDRERVRQDFVLLAGRSSAVVRVTDEGGGPVEGAEIVVSVERGSAGPAAVVVLAARSDARGIASFEDLPADRAELHWSAFARGVGAASGSSPAAAAGESRGIDAQLDGVITIKGMAVDAQGRPAPRAALRLSQTQGPWAEDVDADEHGAFEVRGTPRGPLEVRASGDWLIASGDAMTFEPPPDQRRLDVRVVVVPASRIEGRVLRTSGEGVAGAEVIAQAPPNADAKTGSNTRVLALTDEHGAFVVRGLARGTTWSLEARASGLAPAFATDVKAGASRVDLVVHGGGALAGVVRDDEGRGVADVQVYVHRMTGDERARVATPEYVFARTDANGRYRAEHLNRGEYRVEVTAQVMAWSDESTRVFRVRVDDDATAEVPPAKVARPGSIRGHVRVEGDAKPPVAISLSLLPEGSGGSPHRRAVACGAGGVFLASDIEPGRYAVTIHDATRGFVTAPSVVVEPGRTTNVELAWGPRVRARGVVRDHEGRPVVGARVDAFRTNAGGQASHGLPGRAPDNFTGNVADTDASGGFTIGGLERGTYLVRVAKAGVPPAIAELVVPSEDSLAIALAPPAKLVVHLVADRRDRGAKVVLIETSSGAGFAGEAITDADGLARFEGLAAGTYRVRAIVPGAKETSVSLRSGETREARVGLSTKEES